MTALCVVILLAGCNLLEFPAYVLFGQRTRKVKAEYRHLKNERIALMVSAGPGIDFEYPYARTDLALACAQVFGQRVEGVRFVEQEEIEKFQSAHLDWATMGKAELADVFGVGHIIWLDLIQFTLREESSVNLLRGRVLSAVRVFDKHGAAPNVPSYQTEISVVVPDHGPLPVSDVALQGIYRQTMLRFADKLASKFYDHKVPIR